MVFERVSVVERWSFEIMVDDGREIGEQFRIGRRRCNNEEVSRSRIQIGKIRIQIKDHTWQKKEKHHDTMNINIFIINIELIIEFCVDGNELRTRCYRVHPSSPEFTRVHPSSPEMCGWTNMWIKFWPKSSQVHHRLNLWMSFKRSAVSVTNGQRTFRLWVDRVTNTHYTRNHLHILDFCHSYNLIRRFPGCPGCLCVWSSSATLSLSLWGALSRVDVLRHTTAQVNILWTGFLTRCPSCLQLSSIWTPRNHSLCAFRKG